jgi:glutathione S-transferase
MSLNLHIIKPSVNSMCVRVLVRAAKLDVTEVDAYGKTRTPEYLQMCPAHLTPFLEDPELPGGGLWEGGAIMQYLCNRFGLNQYYPADPARRAQQDSALLYVTGSYYPMLARAVYPVLGFPNHPTEVSGSNASAELKTIARETAQDALVELLEIVHKGFLRGDDFIGGTTPTIADFRLAATFEFLPAINYQLPHWAQHYHQRLEQKLGSAWLEPAADVRGFLAYVKSQKK